MRTACATHSRLITGSIPGKRRIDEADLRVGLGAEIGRGAAEQFCSADDLGMHLQADDDLPGAARTLDRVAHRLSTPARIAGSALKPAARSTTAPTAKTVSSSNGRPITCSPSGNPSASSPAGTEIAGHAGEIGRHGEYVVQLHLNRIIHVLALRERGRWRRRCQQRIDLGETPR